MTLESSFDSRSGAQFIRKTFTGVGGMVACEFDFKYQCSIVACVNGVEVVRNGDLSLFHWSECLH